MVIFLQALLDFISVELTVLLTAALLEMCFKLTIPAILIGNIIAGVLIMNFSYGMFKMIGEL